MLGAVLTLHCSRVLRKLCLRFEVQVGNPFLEGRIGFRGGPQWECVHAHSTFFAGCGQQQGGRGGSEVEVAAVIC